MSRGVVFSPKAFDEYMKKHSVFFNNGSLATLKERNRLKLFLTHLSSAEGRELESLSYVFCSKKDIVDINKRFLAHNYPTDIITFDLSNSKKEKIIAEIYVCPEVVYENARHYQQTRTMEIHRVIFHGLLHLCGYDDKTGPQQKKMREKENEWLEKYFVSRGTK